MQKYVFQCTFFLLHSNGWGRGGGWILIWKARRQNSPPNRIRYRRYRAVLIFQLSIFWLFYRGGGDDPRPLGTHPFCRYRNSTINHIWTEEEMIVTLIAMTCWLIVNVSLFEWQYTRSHCFSDVLVFRKTPKKEKGLPRYFFRDSAYIFPWTNWGWVSFLKWTDEPLQQISVKLASCHRVSFLENPSVGLSQW